MTGQEPIQVWVVSPKGRFIEQEPVPVVAEDDEDEPEIPMLFEDDPDVLCPCCAQPIRSGDLTINLTEWGTMYAGQLEGYPLYGTMRPIHLRCLPAAIGNLSDVED